MVVFVLRQVPSFSHGCIISHRVLEILQLRLVNLVLGQDDGMKYDADGLIKDTTRKIK